MYERQERLGEDRRIEKLEQPELAVVMTKGTSSQKDQMRENMAEKIWSDCLKHTGRTPRVE